jgi:hypothetical protein
MDVEDVIDVSDIETELDEDHLEEVDEVEDDEIEDDNVENNIIIINEMEEDADYTESDDDENCTSRNFVR